MALHSVAYLLKTADSLRVEVETHTESLSRELSEPELLRIKDLVDDALEKKGQVTGRLYLFRN